MKKKLKKMPGGGSFSNLNPEISTGLLGLLSFLAAPEDKKEAINNHLSDNIYNPIATPLGVQTGPIGHFEDGGLIPDLLPKRADITPVEVLQNLTSPSQDFSTPVSATKEVNSTNIDNKLFKTYMAHQQGVAGAKAIFKAAETGKSWKTFFKGKEDLSKNMANNVGKDFYENYSSLNPATFVNYWEGKFNRAMRRAAKKSSPLDGVYQEVGQSTGINPLFLKATAMIESSQNPNSNYNKSTQYKGLYQLNSSEFNQNGGGNIYDPLDNAYAAASNFNKLKSKFKMGGEYKLSDEEIESLRDQGYDFDILN